MTNSTSEEFNIYKNITESFSLTIPDFSVAPNIVVRMTDTLSMVATPHLEMYPSVTFALASPTMVETATATPVGPNTYTYDTTADDCALQSIDSTHFSSTGTSLSFGSGVSHSYKVWMPFIVTLAKSTTIISAIIHFVAKDMGQQSTNVKIKIGCDNSGNALVPTDYYDLNSRVMTQNFTIVSPVPVWTPGTTYSYDITTAMQEVINNASWVSGNILAVMVVNYGSGSGNYNYHRETWSFDHGSDYPTLTVIA